MGGSRFMPRIAGKIGFYEVNMVDVREGSKTAVFRLRLLNSGGYGSRSCVDKLKML